MTVKDTSKTTPFAPFDITLTIESLEDVMDILTRFNITLDQLDKSYFVNVKGADKNKVSKDTTCVYPKLREEILKNNVEIIY